MESEVRELKNNYQDVIEMWKKRAVEWDFQERYAAMGLSGYCKEGNLPISFYGEDYEINRKNGSIAVAGKDGAPARFDTAMSIYSLLYHSCRQPHNAGVWVPFRDVKRAAPFAKAFQRETLAPFARTFNGHLDKLRQAGQALGFEPISHSDAGFQAMAFSCVPVQFLFWDGDDEFEAQSNILFDTNITDYVHEETVVLIAAEGTRRLKEAAGL